MKAAVAITQTLSPHMHSHCLTTSYDLMELWWPDTDCITFGTSISVGTLSASQISCRNYHACLSFARKYNLPVTTVVSIRLLLISTPTTLCTCAAITLLHGFTLLHSYHVDAFASSTNSIH